jgi:broad specificity phosphatase PhoE
MKIFQGSTDCDISEDGAKQLEFLKKRFTDIHIDRAYSSPLIRAVRTAEKAVEGKGIPVERVEGFTEIYGGVIEGRPFAEFFAEDPALKDTWEHDIQNFAPAEGESMREVYARVKKAFRSLINDPENKDKTLLVASHGAVLKALLCHLVYDDIERLGEIPWADNTAVSLVVADENGVRIEYYGDTSHLPEEFKPVSVLKLWENKE